MTVNVFLTLLGKASFVLALYYEKLNNCAYCFNISFIFSPEL